jgi:hypothetical protein
LRMQCKRPVDLASLLYRLLRPQSSVALLRHEQIVRQSPARPVDLRPKADVTASLSS